MENGSVKVADFGVSAELDSPKETRSTVVGTPHYMSPGYFYFWQSRHHVFLMSFFIEMITGSSYDKSSDIWSLGITLYELCEGEPPYRNKNEKKALSLISARPSPTLKDSSQWSLECHDFLRLCLQKKPESRPGTKTLMRHAWVEDSIKRIIQQEEQCGAPALKYFVERNIEAIMALRCDDDDASTDSGRLSGRNENFQNYEAEVLAELNEAQQEVLHLSTVKQPTDEKCSSNALVSCVDIQSVQPIGDHFNCNDETLDIATGTQEVDSDSGELKEKVKSPMEEHLCGDVVMGVEGLEEVLDVEPNQWISSNSCDEKRLLMQQRDDNEIVQQLTQQELQVAKNNATDNSKRIDSIDPLQSNIEQLAGGKQCLQHEEENKTGRSWNALNSTGSRRAIGDVHVADRKPLPCPDRYTCIAMKQCKGSLKLVRKWKKAFFALDSSALSYYRSENDYQFNQSLPRNNSSHMMKKHKTFQFSLKTQVRSVDEELHIIEVFDTNHNWLVPMKFNNEMDCNVWQSKVQELLGHLQAEKEANEEAARLQAEKEANEEEASRLQAEKEAAEEAARLQAEKEAHEEEASRLQAEKEANEEAARLQAEKEAAEEAARLQAEKEAHEEEAARLQAEKEAAEEAARLQAEKAANEEAARLQAEKAANEEEAARLQAEKAANEEEAARLQAEKAANEEEAGDQEGAKRDPSLVQINRVINGLQLSEQQQELDVQKKLSRNLRDKIREKDHHPSSMRGWVQKRTDHIHKWKKRYVHLNGTTLRYYLTDKNMSPRGEYKICKDTIVRTQENVVRIDNLKQVQGNAKAMVQARPFIFRLDEKDFWTLNTWVLAIKDNIDCLERNEDCIS